MTPNIRLVIPSKVAASPRETVAQSKNLYGSDGFPGIGVPRLRCTFASEWRDFARDDKKLETARRVSSARAGRPRDSRRRPALHFQSASGDRLSACVGISCRRRQLSAWGGGAGCTDLSLARYKFGEARGNGSWT